jgi:hypothetical protein
MALLWIAEFADVMHSPVAGQNRLPIPLEPAIMFQGLTIQPDGNVSQPFRPETRLVRLHCDAECAVEFGTNPVAGPGKQRMTANQTEYKAVPAGGGLKVAVIAA